MGVDPGTRVAGLVALAGHGAPRLLYRKQLRLGGGNPNTRLARLARAVEALLDRTGAAVLALEDPSHPRNARTAHLLGRAVGVCVVPAVHTGPPGGGVQALAASRSPAAPPGSVQVLPGLVRG